MKFNFSRAFYFAVRRALTWGLATGVALAIVILAIGGRPRAAGSVIVVIPYAVFWLRLIWEVFAKDPPDG